MGRFVRIRSLLALAGLCLLLGCAEFELATPLPPEAPIPTHVWIGIDDAADPIFSELDANFEVDPAELVIHLSRGGANPLIQDLGDDFFDAVIVHEFEGIDAWWFSPVAVDGLVFYTHADAPPEEWTLETLAQAFQSGERPLFVYPSRHAAQTLFESRVMRGRPIDDSAVVVSSFDEMQARLAETPMALGFGFVGPALDGIRPISIDGISATPQTLTDQSYPIIVPIYFVAPQEPRGKGRAVLSWLQAADQGQERLGSVYGRVN